MNQYIILHFFPITLTPITSLLEHRRPSIVAGIMVTKTNTTMRLSTRFTKFVKMSGTMTAGSVSRR